jgi:hypothetical protein
VFLKNKDEVSFSSSSFLLTKFPKEMEIHFLVNEGSLGMEAPHGRATKRSLGLCLMRKAI